jgi:1-aminocyclopropane-1-carboxylate deaminase/D-cysteine desulfhydrase-like pyridoxal-dependent ACC family enzyme
MCEWELQAEIVQSGTWLYADEIATEVWIVKQNFEFHHEPDFDEGTEELNQDGEAFQVVFARARQMISLGPARLSLPEAISAAEELITTKIIWTNHLNQMLFGGRRYSIDPVPGE